MGLRCGEDRMMEAPGGAVHPWLEVPAYNLLRVDRSGQAKTKATEVTSRTRTWRALVRHSS